MGWLTIQGKVTDLIKKNKYVFLILTVGLLLLVMPSFADLGKEKEVIPQSNTDILSVEDQLAQILSYVRGAGKVQVMLSIASGEETLYQTDDNHSTNADHASAKSDTVTVTGSDRIETGLVRQINPPVYSGAIIVCQGADDPTVKFAIVEAVSNLTGLGADKISVLKMK